MTNPVKRMNSATPVSRMTPAFGCDFLPLMDRTISV
jgi:hypothetical protein